MIDTIHQRLIDWEACSDLERCERLVDQAAMVRCHPADIALLLILDRFGCEVQHEGLRLRSSLVATYREITEFSAQLAREFRTLVDRAGQPRHPLPSQAKLSRGAAAKAKARLIGRGVLRYELADCPSTSADWQWIVSWQRVWGLDLRQEIREGRQRRSHCVHGAFTPPQEEKRFISNPIPRKNLQEDPNRSSNQATSALAAGRERNDETPAPIGPPAAQIESVDARLTAYQRAAQAAAESLAERILHRVGVVERRHETPAQLRLTRSVALQIAEGIGADVESGKGHELERVFGSLERRDEFSESPAAYFRRCCQRRSWIPYRDQPLVALKTV